MNLTPREKDGDTLCCRPLNFSGTCLTGLPVALAAIISAQYSG